MKILFVDDDEIIRRGIGAFLTSQNHEVVTVPDGKKAFEILNSSMFNLIITDVQMPEMNGLELLKAVRKKGEMTPIIVITAFASIENAVEAMKIGANDYLTKPLNLEELKIKIDKIRTEIKLKEENAELKEKLRQIEFPEIVGQSKEINSVKKLILKVAENNSISVMLYGKSGTGKELAARAIHKGSRRSGKPFVAINCAAMPDELLESELFGYSKGSFTGALKSKEGLFSAADGGTLFLDEVGEMSPRLQAKLLRVLQDFTIMPLGTTKSFKVNVRIIGASNVRLKELVENGKFREDLFYRLNVAEITLPELSKRAEDIPLLISHFLSLQKTERKINFTQEALTALMNYNWPGNIRELENIVKTISLFTENDIVDIIDLPENIIFSENFDKNKLDIPLRHHDFQEAQKKALENFERRFIKHYLKKYNGNISKTSEVINLSRVSLHKKIKQYNLL